MQEVLTYGLQSEDRAVGTATCTLPVATVQRVKGAGARLGCRQNLSAASGSWVV
jgi:hypothetical protein